MCLGGGSSETPKPQPPAQVLNQDAPTKKTANTSDTTDLSIGTKKYRSETGVNTTKAPTKSSSIPSVSM